MKTSVLKLAVFGVALSIFGAGSTFGQSKPSERQPASADDQCMNGLTCEQTKEILQHLADVKRQAARKQQQATTKVAVDNRQTIDEERRVNAEQLAIIIAQIDKAQTQIDTVQTETARMNAEANLLDLKNQEKMLELKSRELDIAEDRLERVEVVDANSRATQAHTEEARQIADDANAKKALSNQRLGIWLGLPEAFLQGPALRRPDRIDLQTNASSAGSMATVGPVSATGGAGGSASATGGSANANATGGSANASADPTLNNVNNLSSKSNSDSSSKSDAQASATNKTNVDVRNSNDNLNVNRNDNWNDNQNQNKNNNVIPAQKDGKDHKDKDKDRH